MTFVRDSELLGLLREGEFEAFAEKVGDKPPDLQNVDLRMADLRGADLKCANLRGAYLRNTDLRGLDLSEAQLEGASLHNARVSGVLFPDELDPHEILMSVQVGTRLRVRSPSDPL